MKESDVIEVKKLDDIYFEESEKESKPKKKRSFFKFFFKFTIFFLIFAGIGLAAFSGFNARNNNSAKNGGVVTSWLDNLGLVGQITHLAVSSDRQLKGEERDRINILLLGVGGKNHDGGWLTDTIMLVSFQPSTKRVSMISIPRDLTVPVENMGWRKINAIGAFAEKENPGSGGLAASQAISELFKVPIDYYLRVDFQGFAKVIDELGGIDVEVEKQLDDYMYPILGQEDNPNYYARYQHLSVAPGLQHMDGSLALKFARSRHGVNGEGSDFARAKRQQLVIQAVKDKLFSASNIFKPTLIGNLVGTYQEHVTTNFQVWEMVKMWDLFKNVKKEQITNKVLDNSPDGLLMDSRGDEGAYILVPRSGDFSQIEYLIANVFADAPATTVEKVVKEKVLLEIRNGTWINGLASKVSTDMEKFGFDVTSVANASMRNYQRSVIYDLTNGAKPQSLELLKEKAGANLGLELPSWLTTELNQSAKANKNFIQPDFVLVVGQSADNTKSGLVNPN
ncbi:LCP family protein [Candidatus Falkowbacteria bacterium]|nr:LCP family protein [Candidatus Falkowbacteria bacterium]